MLIVDSRMFIRASTGPSQSMFCCTKWTRTGCPMRCLLSIMAITTTPIFWNPPGVILDASRLSALSTCRISLAWRRSLEDLKNKVDRGFGSISGKQNEWDPDNSAFQAAGDLGMIVSIIGDAADFASARFKKLLDVCPKTQFCLERASGSQSGQTGCRQAAHDVYRRKALELRALAVNTTIKVPGLGEILGKPSRLPNGYPYDTVPPHYEMAKAAFGVQRMMWGSNFPPCAAKEGYRNALEGILQAPAVPERR